MAEEGGDEIADLVSGAASSPASKPRRRKKKVETAAPPDDESSNGESEIDDDSDEDEGKPQTHEDLDLKEMLPSNALRPVENVKTLGDLIAKYNIGQSTEYKLQVWRTYPKIFPGGVKADGFYDTWDQPLTEELIQSEYGGGGFRVVVMGPHPTKPNTLKHFDSISLNLAGNPKVDRQPKAIQQSQAAAVEAATPPPFLMQSQENAKLSETAMKLATDMAKEERAERIRAEERTERKAAEAVNATLPLVEAERRHADDRVKAERERSDLERKMLSERLDETRAEAKKLLERIDAMETNRPTVGQELKDILPLVTKGNGDGDGSSQVLKSMMDGVLDKHRIEMEAMRAAHQSMIDNLSKQHEASLTSMRQSHANEIAMMREANAREIAAERESARQREQRIEERREADREERRRDQDSHKQAIDNLERSWKERLESQLQMKDQSWESRHQSVIGTLETRNVHLQGEIDRLKGDLADAKNRLTDHSDPIAIVHKAKEIKEAIGGGDSGSSGGGGGGGIGMGGAEDWKNIAVEGLTERAPQILQALGNMLGGQQPQQQQQQYQPGQVVQTAQGEMVVVQTAQGLALVPKHVLDQEQARQQGRMLPKQQSNGQRRQRVMPDVDEVAHGTGRRRRKGPVSAVQNFADPSPYGSDPLPVRGRRPPWEGGGTDGDDEDEVITPPNPMAQPQLPQSSQPRASTPKQEASPQQQRIVRQMSPQERQGLSVIAKLVHNSVMNADDPDEFVDKILKEWNPEILRRVTSGYSPSDIARGIMESQPSSAGATPAGQQFVREAFAKIEEALRE